MGEKDKGDKKLAINFSSHLPSSFFIEKDWSENSFAHTHTHMYTYRGNFHIIYIAVEDYSIAILLYSIKEIFLIIFNRYTEINQCKIKGKQKKFENLKTFGSFN